MPKNEVNDPITGQEIAFAHLVLSGTMTDRSAAETVGLHPDSAASTKARPPVHAYLQEHQAAVQQDPVEQGADLSRLPVGRAVEDHRPRASRAIDAPGTNVASTMRRFSSGVRRNRFRE